MCCVKNEVDIDEKLSDMRPDVLATLSLNRYAIHP